MIIRSINNRLLLTLTIFIAFALGLSSYALDRAFRNSAETALSEKLKAHFYSLLAAADDEAGQLVMPPQLSDPLFNQIESGLYALINDAQHKEVWRSPSAIGLTLPAMPRARTGKFDLQHSENDENGLFTLSYGIIWELEDGKESHYQIHLLQSAHPIMAEIAEFRVSLWRWFGAIGLILIIVQSAIMRWGLAPLRQLTRELIAIETGQKQQLSGDYPSELEGVTHNLNLLINNERRQRQRYRDTSADLAHSLKTPLAILRGLSFNSAAPQRQTDQQQSLAEQVTRMDEIISHQLQRAGAKSTPAPSLSLQPVKLAPLVNKLLRSLGKVYADKDLRIANNIPATLELRADERDLMEVLGNLLDNAFKASRQQLTIAAEVKTAAKADRQNTLIIEIADDGSGIPAALRSAVLERGSRADTHHPGQGLGLTVARDILKSYQGELTLASSTLGGALIRIQLPLF